MADHRQRHQIKTRNSKNNILHGVRLLILISGDIGENPGPIKFPCGSCAKPVKKNQKAIQWEDCLFLYHIKCINLPVTDYITLSIVGTAVDVPFPNLQTHFSKSQ